MEYAAFDRSRYPIIIVTFTGQTATDTTFSEYLKGLSNNYNRGEKIKILFDATDAKFPSIRHQKMQGKWLKENESLMKEQCSGIAYVIPNTLIRKALNLIFSIQSQPAPLKVLDTKAKGIAWLDEIDS